MKSLARKGGNWRSLLARDETRSPDLRLKVMPTSRLSPAAHAHHTKWKRPTLRACSPQVIFSSIQFSSVHLQIILFLSISLFMSVQFNSVQFNLIQFSSIQFSSIVLHRREQTLTQLTIPSNLAGIHVMSLLSNSNISQ